MAKSGKTLAILTGGGDVPGLNAVIRALTLRALIDGGRVIGIRRGWDGLVQYVPEAGADNSENVLDLTYDVVNRKGRTGGTILHSSRTLPSKLPKDRVPSHLIGKHSDDVNDVTPHVLRSLDHLGVECLIAIGGDDTLSYACRLEGEGVPVIGIPKTMDNDVSGTDYCIGFSTCVTRTIELANQLRTSAGSHERFLVIEVFGRYAGFTALVPTIAGAANRCVIPEHPFEIELLTELLCLDRKRNPSRYASVLVSEGARFADDESMTFESGETDQYGHAKLGGIGDRVARELKERSARYNAGRKINIVNQRLGYLVRSGNPDAYDSLVGTAFGNLAYELIASGEDGRLVAMRKGLYSHVPIGEVVGHKRQVDVETWYAPDRLRPRYTAFSGNPVALMSTHKSSD